MKLYKLVKLAHSLSLGFMAVKRHHDRRNFYKGKHLIEAGFQSQRFSPSSSWQEAWHHAGRHGAGEGAGRSASGSKASRRELCVSHWVCVHSLSM